MDSRGEYPQISGELFEAVQRNGVFQDSKVFVDAIPERPPEDIKAQFQRNRSDPEFDIADFVREHFQLPADSVIGTDPTTISMEWYLDELWQYLVRNPSEAEEWETFIPVPYQSVIPGGRFREPYYWDTYFVAEGLAATGRFDLIEDLIENCAWLIDQFGFIPNGNRVYYTSRSNPPVFYLMVDLLARKYGAEAIHAYLPQLDQEHEFWMDGQETVTTSDQVHQRVVHVPGGGVLNRYWDEKATPREEAYTEDLELNADTSQPEESLYRNIRAACESGWDFSSRWFDESFGTICTTDLVPVDLNALLYGMEANLADWYDVLGEQKYAEQYSEAAAQRRRLIDEHCWSASDGYYFDYDWKTDVQTDTWSLAGIVPLFCGMATQDQAEMVATQIEERFLHPGGLVTTLTNSGEQWDAPNGWAPLQWMAVVGLQTYGFNQLAEQIAGRWLDLNRMLFDETGLMLEKYDVTGGHGKGQGGEYSLQFGFGWTNGVVLALPSLFY